MAKRKGEFDDDFDYDFMNGKYESGDDDINPEEASIMESSYIPTETDYKAAVLQTHKVIKYAMDKLETSDGLLALYNTILQHYNSIQNHAKIPEPPDEKTTGVPLTSILSDTNYKKITDEILLVSHIDKLLLLLDDMCGKIKIRNIYPDYSLKMNGWLRMIIDRQQPPSKKAKKGGKSRRRHRKTKRKQYSRRRR
jgi:hypothetical protein